MKINNSLRNALFPLLFSGAIICGLFQLSILEEIKVLVWQADLRYWLLAIPLVVVAQVIRTLRVAIATALPVSPNIYRLVSQHLFMSTIMPFRAGELVFPWMLQRDYGVPYSRSIGILLALRFYDLLVILAIGTISTATLLGQLPEYVRYENILFVAGFSGLWGLPEMFGFWLNAFRLNVPSRAQLSSTYFITHGWQASTWDPGSVWLKVIHMKFIQSINSIDVIP